MLFRVVRFFIMKLSWSSKRMLLIIRFQLLNSGPSFMLVCSSWEMILANFFVLREYHSLIALSLRFIRKWHPGWKLKWQNIWWTSMFPHLVWRLLRSKIVILHCLFCNSLIGYSIMLSCQMLCYSISHFVMLENGVEELCVWAVWHTSWGELCA